MANTPTTPTPSELDSKEESRTPRFCDLRSQPRKFGISFVVPDRVCVEISDRTKIRGRHPMRIFRIPTGGPVEFHRMVEEARQEAPPLKTWDHQEEDPRKWPNPRKAYHRTRLNDWHPQVLYYPPSFFPH